MSIRCDVLNWINSHYENNEEMRKQFAKLSKIVYKLPKDRQNELNRFDLSNNFIIVKQYSNINILVLYDLKCGNFIVSFRGTDDKNKIGQKWRDIYTDLFIALGQFQYSNRYREAEDLLKILIRRYGKERIVLTGHSLGGKVAFDLSKKYDIPAVIYNQGSSPLDINTNPNALHYNTNKNKFDILSASSYYLDDVKTQDVKVKEGNKSHDLDNFL